MLRKREAVKVRKTLVRLYDLPLDTPYVDVAKRLYDDGLLVEFGGERRAPINKEEAGALLVAISHKINFRPDVSL